ncbi:MAG: hypothetical protein WCW44_05015 [archaeon]|jgi:hypothetical protein
MNLSFLRRAKPLAPAAKPKRTLLRDGRETIIGIGGSAINRIFVRTVPGEKHVVTGKDTRPNPFTLKAKK